jgi:putative protease
MLEVAARAGVDAVIVQDLGLLRLARELVPELPLHASTQMSLTEPRGIALAARLGVRRVIMPRELSVEELGMVAAQCPGVELEVFVHGALCISFSGQCLASASLGGRSANRGWCAQPCRLPYGLLAPGRSVVAAPGGCPLSPADLAGHERLGALLRAGVRCFKIEGRLKPARYVAAAVGFYRRALDAALAGGGHSPTSAEMEELALSFSRGFTRGWLDGPDHAGLVGERQAAGKGVLVGKVAGGRVARGILAQLNAPVKPGDGLLVATGGEDEPAGRVYQVLPRSDGQTELRFAETLHWPEELRPGTTIWKTSDPAIDRRLDALAAAESPVRTEPLDASLRAVVGGPLQLTLRDQRGNEVRLSGDTPLAAARSRPLTTDLLREQLGRLGGTPFRLGEVTVGQLDAVMVPKSLLNRLRRQAVEELTALRRRQRVPAVVRAGALEKLLQEAGSTGPDDVTPPPGPIRLTVLAHTLEQAAAAAAWRAAPGRPGVHTVWSELPEVRHWPQAVAVVRAAGVAAGLALPRVMLPGEERLLDSAAACRPDSFLVRNLAAADCLGRPGASREAVGDFSLNAANGLAAALLLERGLSRLTPAYEAGPDELEALLDLLPAERFEAVLWRHVPMFHTRHCLHGAALAGVRSCAGCPGTCRAPDLRLLDRKGAELTVTLDAARRTTVWGARPQCEAAGAVRLLAAGVRVFRVELLGQSAGETRRLLDGAAELLVGGLDAETFVRSFGAARRPVNSDGQDVRPRP